VNVLQGVIGLALERHRLLCEAGRRSFEPLVVLAPYSIKPWYDLINSELIPLNSVIRYVWTEMQIRVNDFCQLLQCLWNTECIYCHSETVVAVSLNVVILNQYNE